MLSRWLRIVIASQAVLLIFLMAALRGGAMLTASAVLVGCGALLLFNGGCVALAYAGMRRYARSHGPPSQPGAAHSWPCTVGELLALYAAFVLIQPFEFWWMGKEPTGTTAPGKNPVLLVPGYLCSRGLWWWLRRRLRDRQFTVATVNLEPPLAGLGQLTARLAERIDALLAETGANKVILVTHSMGGLVARAYLQRHGSSRVERLVTVAAPHQGTRLARLGWGANARDMEPGSVWLQRLNGQPLPPIPVHAIWSTEDEILVPPDAGRLAGAKETILGGVGHIAMAFSPKVLGCLQTALAED